MNASLLDDITIVNLDIPAGEEFAKSQKVLCVNGAIAVHINSDRIYLHTPTGKIFPQAKQILCISNSVSVDITRDAVYNLNTAILYLKGHIFLINVDDIAFDIRKADFGLRSRHRALLHKEGQRSKNGVTCNI